MPAKEPQPAEQELKQPLPLNVSAYSLEGGAAEPERSSKLIRLYFRNMKHINKKFRVEDPEMRQLNFIYLDLDLKMEKVERLSPEDIDLLKAL